MSRGPLLVGFDVGTTNAKGAVVDLGGRALAQSSASYGIDRPHPGWAEQEPEGWWRAVVAVLHDLGRQVDLGGVEAVGVCSQVNTHVCVDEAGAAVGPAIVWQDQRCAGVAQMLDARLDDADRIRLWGGPFRIDSSFLLARAAWVREEQPERWSRIRWILSPKDYLNLRLCGVVGTDPISPIGLVGPDGSYVEEVFELVPGTRRLMPPIAPFTHVLGHVAGEETGLPDGARVVVATMDAWGNLYGSGVVSPGTALEVAGTSEVIGALSREAHPTPGIITFLPVDGLYLHAGPTQAGGEALRWFADANGSTIPDVLAEAETTAVGADGLVFLPHLLGERAPLWDPDARAVFFGLSSEHRRAHLARAVLEGVAYSARHLLEEVERAAGAPVAAINASGGGTRSDLWCQIKADALGREVRRLEVAESGALGAALMAGVGAGLLPSLPEAAAAAVRFDRVFEPDPARGRVLDGLYRLYRGLYPALRERFAELSALRGATG